MRKITFGKTELHKFWTEQVNAVRSAIQIHTEAPVPAVNAFILLDSPKIGASVSAIEPLQPVITVNSGTIKNIATLFTELCKNDYFFIFPSGVGKKKYLLTALATRWILLHELAHWLLGHCGAVAQHFLDEGTQHLVVFAADEDEPMDLKHNDKLKYLELQADGLAFELLLHHATFADESTDTTWKWIDAAQNPNLTDVDVITQKIRSIMVAGSSVVLAMEQLRRAAFGMNLAYPLPLTRLTNLMATAIGVMSDYIGVTEETPDGRLVINPKAYQAHEEIFNTLVTGLAASMLDAGLMAETLGVSDVLVGDTEISVEINLKLMESFNQKLIFLQNLQKYMNNQSFRPKPSEWNSLSFNEYIDLHNMRKIVDPLLFDYAIIDF
ncbi:hypothetical protein [Thiothrix eikelboomii]|uniref:hypothetical protein n=1 Tax=Thiothrix eikelboomii TaxID=92487 RepID=UPI00118024D4|nr:hypothetical protein [Thiothrix eikelboomii]